MKWNKGANICGWRKRLEEVDIPASWMQPVGLEDHEHWKEILWMERYHHGKTGKHKTGPWSCETPTKLEEEASVLGRYLLLIQRGCSGHSDSPIQLGRRGWEVRCFGGQKVTCFEE